MCIVLFYRYGECASVGAFFRTPSCKLTMYARIEERNQWMESVVNGDEGVLKKAPTEPREGDDRGE